MLPYPPFRRHRHDELSPLLDIGAGVDERGRANAGIAALPRELTINGQSVSPLFRYLGKDANATDWTADAGVDLTNTLTGSDVVTGLHCPTPASEDRSVKFTAGEHYSGGANSFGTGDICVEFLWRRSSSIGGLLGNYSGSVGVGIRDNGPGSTLLFVAGDATGIATSGSGNFGDGWNYALFFADRDEASANGSRWYINGEQSGSGSDVSARQLEWGPGVMRVGVYSGQSVTGGIIALCAGYTLDGWFTGGASNVTTWNAFAAERFHQLAGAYSSRYGVPTQSLLRNSAAMLERRTYGEVVKRFTVGSRVPRLETRRDIETDRDLDGVVSNGFPHAEDFTQSNWTKAQCSVATGTGVYDHTGKIEMQGLVADGSSGAHAFATALIPSSNWRHLMLAEVAPGDKTAIRFSSTNLASYNVWQQFDLTGDGALGAHSANLLNAFIIKRANGRYLCGMVYNGGTANHTHLFVPVVDAYVDDATYTGDGSTVDLYITAAQHDYSEEDAGRTEFASYVRTVGSGRTVGKPGAGYSSEAQEQNICLQSESLSTAPWAKVNAGDAITVGVESSEYGSNLNSVIADAVDTLHAVEQSVTLTAATWFIRGEAKRGDKDWLFVYVPTLVNASAYFNLLNGTVGTVGAGATAKIRDLGDGKMQWELAVTGTAAAHTPRIAPAEADGDNSFAGDGATPNVYVGRINVSLVGGSYIKTTTAAVTRLADAPLDYRGVALPQRGTIALDVLMPDRNLGSLPLGGMNDGGSVNQRVEVYHDATTDAQQTIVSAGSLQANIIGSTDISDGKWREVRSTFSTNDVRAYVDGVAEGTPDTSCNIPAELDRVTVGGNYNGAASGALVRMRLFGKKTTKHVTEFT